jgi:hypothetical protein
MGIISMPRLLFVLADDVECLSEVDRERVWFVSLVVKVSVYGRIFRTRQNQWNSKCHCSNYSVVERIIADDIRCYGSVCCCQTGC